jgi:hypothetical protein
MRSPYVILYRGAFSFPLSPCDMWNELERPDRLARGRRWVEVRQVDPRGLQPGAALLCVVEPPLPYRMSLEVVVVEASRCEFVEVEIHGDLEGHAELRLEPAGEGTRASVSWQLEMTQPRMRAAARVVRPILRWGHDRVVDAAARGFRRHVGRRQDS